MATIGEMYAAKRGLKKMRPGTELLGQFIPTVSGDVYPAFGGGAAVDEAETPEELAAADVDDTQASGVADEPAEMGPEYRPAEMAQAAAVEAPKQPPTPLAPPVPPAGSVDATPDDTEGLKAARSLDRDAALSAMLQRAGRQLVAGLTRTKEAETIATAPDAERRFVAGQASKREAALKAMADARAGRMAEADINLKTAEAERARRLPAAPAAKVDHFAEGEAAKDRRQAEALAAAERRARIAAAAGGARAGQKEEANIQELAKRTQDAAPIAAALERLKDRLPPEGQDIPGVGKLDALVPDWVQSTEGLELQNQAKDLTDKLLKLQSGAGVSNEERANKYRQYGIGGADERAFRAGMKRLEADLHTELKSKGAGFTPEVVQTYRARGGTGAADVPEPGAARGGPREGDTKTLSTGRVVVYRGGKWGAK